MPVEIRPTLVYDLYDVLSSADLPDGCLRWVEKFLAMGEVEIAFETAVLVAVDEEVPLPATLLREVLGAATNGFGDWEFNDGFLERVPELRAT